MRRGLVLLSVALAGGLVAASATAATAVELPAYQRIATIDSNTGVIYDVNPSTAEATELWESGILDAVGIILDDAGQGFVTNRTGPFWQSALWKIDAVSKTQSLVGELTLAGSTSSGICHSLQQYNGELVGYCAFYEAEFLGGTNTFSRIDPTTATFTPLFTFTRGGTEDISPAIDPADEATFFAAGPRLALFDLQTLNTDEEDWAEPFIVAEFPKYVASGSFGANSILWLTVPEFDPDSTTLTTWDRATSEITDVGPIEVDGQSILAFGVTIWGAAEAAPQLAATGASGIPIGFGAVALVLVLGGALLWMGRTRATA